MEHLGFESSRADPDVQIRNSAKKDNATKLYEYVLLYTDKCLVISNQAESIPRNAIGKYFELIKHPLIHHQSILLANFEKLSVTIASNAEYLAANSMPNMLLTMR